MLELFSANDYAFTFLIFTFLVVTGVLLSSLRLIRDTLLSPSPQNPKVLSIQAMLTEKNPSPPPTKAADDTTQQEPPLSSSRLGMAMGSTVLAVMSIGFGYYLLWALFTKQTVDLKGSGVTDYFLAGSALFAPYAFNQLSSVFRR